jgi:hypothetical protein
MNFGFSIADFRFGGKYVDEILFKQRIEPRGLKKVRDQMSDVSKTDRIIAGREQER